MDFSYSRLSCYRQCPRKFDLHYVQKISPIISLQPETLRGLFLHEYGETFIFNEKFNSIDHTAALQSFETEKNYKFSEDDKKIILQGIFRLQKFYSEYIIPMRQKGYQLITEGEYLTDFHNHQMTVKIDVLLLKRGEAIIIDYKTGRTINVNYYKEQLAFYKMAISQIYTIAWNDIQTKICLLMANVQDNLLKNFLLPVVISSIDLREYEKGMLETLNEIGSSKRKIEPNLTKMCYYCDHRKDCDVYTIVSGE